MNLHWWAEPTAGDIVWCQIPDDVYPQPKTRPALVMTVFDDEAPNFWVRVIYGTSQRPTTLHAGEFAILRLTPAAAYASAGLSFDNKFNFKRAIDLPFNNERFAVPPAAPHGQTPKLGSLHASMVRAAHAAFLAAAV